MSDANVIERGRGGRFVTGTTGGPGRKVGSRNKLGEQFVSDLQTAWETHGAAIISRVIRDDPAAMLKVIAGLLPKDINLSVEHSIDAERVLLDFRRAVQLLQSDQLGAQAKVLTHAKRS